MTSHTTDSTDSTTPKTTRRRTLAALVSTTLGLAASAGCLSGGNSENTTTNRSNDGKRELPDTFEAVSVGAYELTVEIANPEELDSVALRRPTSGVLDRQQAGGTHTFSLMESIELYDPGKFVVEAKADSEVVAEHAFELEPDIRITKIEFLKESTQEKLTSTRGPNETCAEKDNIPLFTVENRGSGPAALGDLKADFPDEISSRYRSSWETPSSFICHGKHEIEWTNAPALAPSQRLTFAPMWEAEAGYRGQEVSAEYIIQMSILEKATDEWKTQNVRLTFQDAGNGNRLPVFDVLEPAENQ